MNNWNSSTQDTVKACFGLFIIIFILTIIGQITSQKPVETINGQTRAQWDAELNGYERERVAQQAREQERTYREYERVKQEEENEYDRNNQ